MRLTACCCLLVLLAACGGGDAIRSEPEKSFAYHYNLGMASFEERHFDEAIKHFKRSIELNPNIARTHIEISTCYMMIGQFGEAVTHLEKALMIDPRMTEAHNSLGVALMNLGRLREAERQFQSVLTSSDYETKYIPLYNLGMLSMQEKHYERALEYFHQALTQEDDISLDYRIQLRTQVGNCHYEMKQYREAFTEFDQALVLNPRMIDVAWRAGHSAWLINDVERARYYLEKVIATDPGSSYAKDARELLGKIGK